MSWFDYQVLPILHWSGRGRCPWRYFSLWRGWSYRYHSFWWVSDVVLADFERCSFSVLHWLYDISNILCTFVKFWAILSTFSESPRQFPLAKAIIPHNIRWHLCLSVVVFLFLCYAKTKGTPECCLDRGHRCCSSLQSIGSDFWFASRYPHSRDKFHIRSLLQRSLLTTHSIYILFPICWVSGRWWF